MSQTIEPAIIEHDERLYLAPSSSVPMVSYLLAVDADAREVCRTWFCAGTVSTLDVFAILSVTTLQVLSEFSVLASDNVFQVVAQQPQGHE